MYYKKLKVGNLYKVNCRYYFYENINLPARFNGMTVAKNNDNLIFLDNLGYKKFELFSDYCFYLKFFIIQRNAITYLALTKDFVEGKIYDFIEEIK